VQAMRGTAVAAGVPATLRTTAATGGLDVEVRVDVAKLPFLNRQGRREQQIVFIAGLFDPSHNRFVIAKRGVVDLALTEATEKRWAREGMGARITLSAPPGRYRLRVVVLEATDGKLSSFSRPAVVYEPNKHSKSGG
ncbi:MAG: hypothetical protein ACREEA_06020, partial [Stellaceae bacterium]